MSTVLLTGVGAGGIIIRRALRSSHGSAHEESQERWRAVTINRPPEQVAPQGRWPDPIAQLGDTVEVQIRPAPGGKGTELVARLRHPGGSGAVDATSRARGETPQQAVRSALRQAKQLIEVGEVLKVDPAPHGKRRHTPGGRLLEAATKRAGQEGVL
ncbi:hypothetical protein [Kocuria arenosa]|uniref:hypothetical protein n=1 Tax=Kocuria arenosa TaxID=3071446 RepID=UPI0034D5C0EB